MNTTPRVAYFAWMPGIGFDGGSRQELEACEAASGLAPKGRRP
ncbi:MAG: hypothetical protein ABMA13_01050 [Chthoniobacteraceae bacterium]